MAAAGVCVFETSKLKYLRRRRKHVAFLTYYDLVWNASTHIVCLNQLYKRFSHPVYKQRSTTKSLVLYKTSFRNPSLPFSKKENFNLVTKCLCYYKQIEINY